MLQAEAAVGCRRLIAAAAASVVVVLLLLAAVVAAPAAFAPLARRDDSDTPAGAITGTRVRSIGVEAGREDRGECASVFAFFFLLCALNDPKMKRNTSEPLFSFPLSLLSLSLILQ